MAPPQLVSHYEDHREWIEEMLSLSDELSDEQELNDYIEGLWDLIPNLPDNW